MKDYIGIGIVGCGMISEKHAAAINETAGARLIGACSHSVQSAQLFSERHGIQVFESYEAMLACPELDAVAVCTPSGSHAGQVIKALEHGKHVVVEKPMCLKLEDADRIVELAEKTGLVVCSIAQLRYCDAAQAIKSAIERGEFGRLLSATLSMRYYRSQEYYDQAQWRGTFEGDGGGVLMNQGIHGIDMLCYLMGQPKEVCGYTATLMRNIEVEDTASAAILFESGAIASVDATTCSQPAFSKRFIICGEKGSVILSEDKIELWSLPTPNPIEAPASTGFSAAADPKSITHAYHVREYADFVNAVLTGGDVLINARQGRLPLEVILGIYRASDERRSICIRPL